MFLIIRFFLSMFLILTFTSCSHYLYYPSRFLYVDKTILKHQPEEIVFHYDVKKNEKLVGWYFQAPRDKFKSPKALFVFFHGNAQNISTHFTSLFWILDEGYDFFIFDYPGYGGSWGHPNPENTKESGILAIQYSQKKWPNTPIFILGQSLGGAVSMSSVLELKDKSNLCGHVVESTFSSYKKAGTSALASNWWTWILQPIAWIGLSDEHAPKDKIKNISPLPLLVIHRKKDPIVSFKLGQEVYELAAQPKELLALEGSGHIDAFTGSGYKATRKQFLEFVNSSKLECSGELNTQK